MLDTVIHTLRRKRSETENHEGDFRKTMSDALGLIPDLLDKSNLTSLRDDANAEHSLIEWITTYTRHTQNAFNHQNFSNFTLPFPANERAREYLFEYLGNKAILPVPDVDRTEGLDRLVKTTYSATNLHQIYIKQEDIDGYVQPFVNLISASQVKPEIQARLVPPASTR